MRRTGISIGTLGMMVASLGIAAACSRDTTAPEESLLAGLARVESNDTVTNAPPPGPVLPGSFHGYILGLAMNGATGDTLSSAARLEGAVVALYEFSGTYGSDNRPIPGAKVASASTNANGEFQVPEVPGGQYIVTLTPQPPDDAVYIAGWTIATIGPDSNVNPWWVYLPRKPE